MAKSTRKKKLGRPVTKIGPGQPTMVRLHKPQLVALDSWIKRQSEPVSRPEAIRRLLDRLLGSRVLT
jgi:hypothetical protein